MMKRIFGAIYILASVLFLWYLVLPSPDFPEPPQDALQSQEPGDSEDLLVRRAYFTDLTREEVLLHYQEQLSRGSVFSKMTYRLNYPPEEASTIIRDQTRSTFLEEIVHPFRESFYVNGFKAEHPADTILIEDKVWNQKVTVKYVQSSAITRLAVAVFALVLVWVVISNWRQLFLSLVMKENGKK